MAEGFEPYHVPQQSRRDKLRVGGAAQPLSHADQTAPTPTTSFHGLMMLPPPYDHHHPANIPTSLIISAAGSSPSDLLTSSKDHNNNNNNNSNNLMALVGSSSSTSSSSNFRNPYSTSSLDPQFHDPNMMSHSFLYGAPSQIMANLHHSHPPRTDDHDHHEQVVVFKPEPLSLSLSSYNNTNTNNNNNNNNNNISEFTPAILGANDGVSRSSVPLGPFTGYASILKESRFLKPAQQLLEEFCYDVVGGGTAMIVAEKLAPDSSLMMMDTNAIVDDDDDRGDRDDDHDEDHDGHDRHISASKIGGEIRKKKSRLISMLDEVYRRYKQYYQQMQAVVASFEYVAGLGNAAPYANLAVKAMTRHFRCLKNAIMDQLQFTGKDNAHPIPRKDEAPIFRSNNRSLYGQRPIHSLGFVDHQPVWRPQRGLPECAVTVLRAWLFEHFLHPYPTDTDKLMLAKQTGLSRSQVSNWFINARVRLWKPMVEEIHMLEMRQAHKGSQRDHERGTGTRPSDHHHMASSNSLASETPSTSTHRVSETAGSKRTRNELPSVPVAGSHESVNLSYDNLASHLQMGGAGVSVAGGSNGVSLTLGLHQNNNGIVLSEPFPINAAQRFGLGLEGGGDGYVMSTFEVQNRHFGRDVIGGQLLHDFVG